LVIEKTGRISVVLNKQSSMGNYQSPIANHQSPMLSSQKAVIKIAERVTHSPEETVLLGREIAVHLQPPCLVLLQGDLGAGKTTLVKGIVAGLGAASEDEVTSPSFTFVHEYGAPGRVYHADLYRIEGDRDLATLGLEDLSSQAATVLVEWGEKLGDNAPIPCVKIRMEHLGSDDRRILIERVEG
jgi:tRNA threonylcarbamoyladenosine biosynthesis protein TsaE